jgi:hypothetical protein
MSDKRDPTQRREALTARIAMEERRIRELQAEIDGRRALVSSLRVEPCEPGGSPVSAQQPGATELPDSTSLSREQKVRLFRSLFRGRDDVFPRLWVNRKTGRDGFSPTCANEWEPGLCAKKGGTTGGRRFNCAECANRSFLPVTDEEIERHLTGKQVIGVYPLLADETCWFLAADFDDRSWREDISVLRETCLEHGLPVAIERSRSGNGAHAWFFFSSPVPSASARSLGCFLITESMARRHQLSMSSYDRLFPNQDTLPRGGFGNLIALPLQREARQSGNTVFVNDQLEPYADQWAFLSSMQRIDSSRLRDIVQEAGRRGQVMGLRAVEEEEQSDGKPWKRPPSGTSGRTVIVGPLPREVRAVLSQRLFVERNGLPAAMVNLIKRLAAFQNPEFYKKQNMRLSTALTPRVISCAEELAEHIALPRGCLPEVEALLREHHVSIRIEDERVEGDPIDVTFRGTLTPLQEQAAQALLAHDTGVLVAPPGTGKTVVGAMLIAMRRLPTLVLVHRQPILDQWVAQLGLFLGLEPKEIGRIGAGRCKPNGRVDIAMMQSLVRRGRVADMVAGYGHVIMDECHHVPAVSFERVLSEVKARFITGLTATPRRRDGLQPILHMQLGPVRFVVDSRSKGAELPFKCTLIMRETGFTTQTDHGGIQELYAQLAADRVRNELICADVIHAIDEGRSPIVLTERRNHLEYFTEHLRGHARHLFVLHGSMKTKQRRETIASLATVPGGETRVLLATGRYIGEGFDDARLDTLFLALPVSWKGTLIQYAGRLHRVHAGKTEVRIYDYVDRQVPMLARMLERRLRGYRAMGYMQAEEHDASA